MDIFQALEEGRQIFWRADQLGSTTCGPPIPLAEVWVWFWSIKDLESAGMAGISNHMASTSTVSSSEVLFQPENFPPSDLFEDFKKAP
jgi:hypothetical protein